MKTKKKSFKIDSTNKLVKINTLIFFFTAMLLYFAIPILLNYPKNSIDNDFQVKTVGIKYTHQFIILITVSTVLLYFALKFIFNRFNINNSDFSNLTVDEIKSIRKKCFNYPYILFILEIFVPSIIVAILLFVFNTEFELVIRISTVIFSLSAIFAIISYMVNRNFFVSKLIQTDKFEENNNNSIRLNLYNKLLIQILPLFLYSFVLILLLSLSLMTTEKSNLINYFYKEELSSCFSENTVYSLEEARDILMSLNLNSENDTVFIFSCDTDEVYYSPVELNKFLKNYTKSFYDISGGHVYEYYGQNVEACVLKIITPNGNYFAGIRYHVFENTFIIPFIAVSFLLLIFNGLFIFYIGKSFSSDISRVVDGMKAISNSNDTIYSKKLPITSNDEISDLTKAFNKIQKLTQSNVEQLKDTQETLMEAERLSSLGQLIGGIAHNLKTPIMSISGAAEGLTDLVKEYDSSIDDPEVNSQDHHDIAKDMSEWIGKIKDYTAYMSDIITAVKGQAVTLSETENVSFDIDELVKRVDILMKHELKNALIYMNIQMKASKDTTIHGDINSLVQVINNMISNAIQSYNGKPEQNIDLILEKQKNNLVISVKDYGSGLPQKVKDKLFKEMITTKGKNGTGLGLYMSYSTIKAHFNGDITFESEEGKGTTFNIILPL